MKTNNDGERASLTHSSYAAAQADLKKHKAGAGLCHDAIDLRPYHRRIWRARCVAAGPRVLRIPCRSAEHWCITHRSTVRPGWWQASWFDAAGPFGHSEHTDWSALVAHVDGSGFGPQWARVEEVQRG